MIRHLSFSTSLGTGKAKKQKCANGAGELWKYETIFTFATPAQCPGLALTFSTLGTKRRRLPEWRRRARDFPGFDEKKVQYCHLRLDENTSKQCNHLLMTPYTAHPIRATAACRSTQTSARLRPTTAQIDAHTADAHTPDLSKTESKPPSRSSSIASLISFENNWPRSVAQTPSAKTHTTNADV